MITIDYRDGVAWAASHYGPQAGQYDCKRFLYSISLHSHLHSIVLQFSPAPLTFPGVLFLRDCLRTQRSRAAWPRRAGGRAYHRLAFGTWDHRRRFPAPRRCHPGQSLRSTHRTRWKGCHRRRSRQCMTCGVDLLRSSTRVRRSGCTCRLRARSGAGALVAAGDGVTSGGAGSTAAGRLLVGRRQPRRSIRCGCCRCCPTARPHAEGVWWTGGPVRVHMRRLV